MKYKLLITIVLLFNVYQLRAETQCLPMLEGIDGKHHSLNHYVSKGKWVLVNVWSPTCTWCLRELPKIEKFNKERGDEITTIGVTLDYPSFEYGKIDFLKTFLQTNPLEYPFFLADKDQASRLIGNPLVGIPQTTIFHPDGRAVARWSGAIEIAEIENYIENFDELYHPDPFDEDF